MKKVKIYKIKEIFCIHISDKALVSTILDGLLHLNNRQITQ